MPHRPIILGIVGDSAAGKTTVTAGIVRILGEDLVTAICIDDYHKYDRAQRKELQITALHPDCNHVDIMEQHLRLLSEGQPILKPIYNHRTGCFDAPEYIAPKPFVIIEGLLGFSTAKLRDCFHVKVYLDPPEELRRQWKVQRDCSRRGYTTDQVLAELDKREPDSDAFIRPQRRWADIVVRFYPSESPPNYERLNVLLSLRSTLAHPDLSDVIAGANGRSALRLRIGRDAGRLTEFLEIAGQVSPEQTATIEDVIWSHLPALQHLRPEQLGAFVDGQAARQSNPLGLTQLLIAYHLLQGWQAKERQVSA